MGRTGSIDRCRGPRDLPCRVVDREPFRQGWRPDLDKLLAIEGGSQGDRLALGGDQLGGPVVDNRILQGVAHSVGIGVRRLEGV